MLNEIFRKIRGTQRKNRETEYFTSLKSMISPYACCLYNQEKFPYPSPDYVLEKRAAIPLEHTLISLALCVKHSFCSCITQQNY